MNSKQAVSMFLVIVVSGAFAPTVSAAPATHNGLSFHGQLVNAGCEASVMGASSVKPEALRAFKVNSSLTVGIVDHNDACESAAVPVTIAYIERASISTASHNGIVTLTYQ